MTPVDGRVDDRVTVSFAPSGRRGEVTLGSTVLDAARTLGVDLDSVCGGRGICGRCQVRVGARPGVPADPARLGPQTATEAAYSGRRPLDGDARLGCAATITADVVIEVPPESQVHRQVVRKDLPAAGGATVELTVDPVVMLRYLEVTEPTLDDVEGDLQRVRRMLAEEWNLPGVAFDLAALSELQPALAAERRAITVAVRRSGEESGTAVAVWPGLRDQVHGVALDIGSTTIAGHLVELTTGAVLASAGRMNPQITFGEDLMSRVSFVMMNADGLERLTAAVRDAVDGVVAELCDQAGLTPTDVLELTIVGNPIMHHVLFGLDPTQLGSAPFALVTTEAMTVVARELGLALHPGARVYAPPCIAGHVGADAAGMTLAVGPHRSEKLTLLVDVGTNAEIVLGNADRLLAASSPTGPAFEGAQISSGQRAAPGAIERVRIDRSTLIPRYRVIGDDAWSDEVSFHLPTRGGAATAGVTGICGSGIIEAVAELFLAGVIGADGTLRPPADPAGDPTGRVVQDGRTWSYRLIDADEETGQAAIEVTQNDVRAIQLAKAALQAGCRLLMDHLEVQTVDRIVLAGAFGSHIDPEYAMVLGMVPDCDLDQVSSAGNAAGQGALMCLLSAAARAEVEDLTARIEKIETATEPAFQSHFVAAMGLPHTTAAYPNLAARVTLPVPSGDSQRASGGRQRTGRRARREPAAAGPHTEPISDHEAHQGAPT